MLHIARLSQRERTPTHRATFPGGYSLPVGETDAQRQSGLIVLASLSFSTGLLRWPQRFLWVSRVDNRVENAAEILEDFVVPKPQDANALFVKLEVAI
jgi:hypothetical protein